MDMPPPGRRSVGYPLNVVTVDASMYCHGDEPDVAADLTVCCWWRAKPCACRWWMRWRIPDDLISPLPRPAMKHLLRPACWRSAPSPRLGTGPRHLLRDADRYRMSADNLQVETLVETFRPAASWTKNAATPCLPRPAANRWC